METYNFLWAFRKYRSYVLDMQKIAPDVSNQAITYAFWRYENEFYVPPDDAFHSIRRTYESGQMLAMPPIESRVMEEDIPNELR